MSTDVGSQSDAAAAAAVEEHHRQLAAALAERVEVLVAAAGRADVPGAEDARAELVRWCQAELVPHALAEEQALYPAAHGRAEGRLLVDGMLAEHQVVTRLVRDLGSGSAAEPVRAAAAGTALQVLFESHLAKENDLVLPLLLSVPEVSVADLLAGMHELLGEG